MICLIMSNTTLPSSTPQPSAIAALRRDYKLASLDEADLHRSPLAQFASWFEQAQKAEVPEPNAMTLATVTPDGKPSARIVLLKGFDEDGFTFYTNYQSRKGLELTAHPYACLVFMWMELERQVRIEGPVTRVSAQESDAYFNVRPLDSRYGAWASPQSQVISSRQVLVDRQAQLRAELGEQPPRPEHWGGYRVQPERIEFWQGRSSRLHDRFRYQRPVADSTSLWQLDRLAP